ncbi:hypothetical protein H8A99_21770 [Bradyrhizobium sp. Arg68]|uniref:PIN domain-containing protein n=1 Tax=Bradyrhizobium ivorense TaxID=2511166 RepID=UPI001E5E25C0|nr:hypothetical protein [Bradyrhizobium ivorense]MCC8939032.1 hypothetical protein [Bradyrhizobium ivorense]
MSTPDGLAPLIEELKARHEWIEEEQEIYRNVPIPLAILAHKVGCDVIDAAEGLASQELSLKVAHGAQDERSAAVRSIGTNRRAGCVFDLLSFWTCWRLGALDAVTETCGAIHVARRTMDQLQARRERISRSTASGFKSAQYKDGKIAVTEASPEVVQSWLDDTDGAIAWLRANENICPLIVPESIPEALRDNLRESPVAIFDSLVLAMQKRLLFISDDLPTRDFGRVFGFGRSAWLQPVFMAACEKRKIDFDTYVKWTAHLIGAGHSYLGISSAALIRASTIDAEAGECPGYYSKEISKMIGGTVADPASHVRVVIEFLRHIWERPSTRSYREPVTGLLLERLVRDRTSDFGLILRTVITYVSDITALMDYFRAWLRGHFVDLARTLRTHYATFCLQVIQILAKAGTGTFYHMQIWTISVYILI